MRLFPKSVLETITRGKRLVKSVTITAIAPRPVIVNAQISRRRWTKTTARRSAAIPIAAGSTGGKTFLSLRSTATTTVQIRKAAPSSGREQREPPGGPAGPLEQVALACAA